MSLIAVVLLVAALVLLVATEWPRIGRRVGSDARQQRARAKRKSNLRVVTSSSSESDDFARSVERDLARLPTIDERDAKKP